jgi:hypothetical protein
LDLSSGPLLAAGTYSWQQHTVAAWSLAKRRPYKTPEPTL